MTEPTTLFPIEIEVVDGHFAIPKDMKLVLIQQLFDGDRRIAYVHRREWTPEKELDATYFDFYPLTQANRFVVNDDMPREFYIEFGLPARVGMKLADGKWTHHAV